METVTVNSTKVIFVGSQKDLDSLPWDDFEVGDKIQVKNLSSVDLFFNVPDHKNEVDKFFAGFAHGMCLGLVKTQGGWAFV